MKKTWFNFIFLSVAVALLGCATGEKSPQKQAKTAKPKTQKEAMEEVSNRLAELTKAAKKAGKEKVDYLAGDLFLKANAASMQEDYATANLIYKHLVNLIPNDDFVNKKYAVSLIRVGKLEESKGLLSKVFKNSKHKDYQTGLLLAGVYSSLGNSKLSKGVYRKILAKNPKNEEACVFLGKAYALEDKFNKSIKTLSGCEKRIKGKGIFSYYIGKLYVDRDKLDKAKYYFKRSAKIEPGFSQATMALGVIHEEQKNNNKAIKVYKKYLKKYPNDPLILNRMVQIYFATEKFKEVIPYAERLSDFEPDNLNLKVKLGILYTDVKDYDLAISTFKDLLKEVPKNDKILYYLGAIYQEQQEWENAIEYFSLITPESGLYQDSSVQVAQMLSSLAQTGKKDNSKEAKRFLSYVDSKITADESPLKVEFSVIKASFYEAGFDYENSITSLESVKNLENFTENHKYYLASLYEKVENFTKSEVLIKEILDKDPKNAHAWNFLGYSLLERRKDLDRAYEYISKAVSLKPKDGFIRDSLGWYYYTVGQFDKALDELLKAIKAEPQDVSIQKHLAILYSQKRNFKQAKIHIKEAIKFSSNKVEKKELDKVLKSIESKRLPASFK